MNDSDTGWNETIAAVAMATSGTRANGSQPGQEAMRCLRESRVSFALIAGDPEELYRLARVDVLVVPAEMEVAAAALRRAGFREVRRAQGQPGPWMFLTYESERFVAIALHHEFAYRGVHCLDPTIAFARRDERAAVPQLAKEDRFLHLLLGAALAGRALTEAERQQLVRLRRDRLEPTLLAAQTQRLGIEALVERALAELDVLLQQPRRWRRFRWRLWATLLRQPGVLGGVVQAWRAQHARRGHPPVLLAVVGPPHAGKTALVATLEAQLQASPLAARCLSMSCWEGSSLWQRGLRALAPAAVSMPRLFRCRRGRRVRLTDAEVEFLRDTTPGLVPLALGAALHGPRTVLFHFLLWCTLRLRHAQRVARCRSPLVIADGWILDLACRSGATPYQHGERWRQWVWRHFPQPDGFVYLSTSYEIAATRAPQLVRTQFEGVDLGLRRMLRPLAPLEFITDEPPRAVALTFLQRYWAHLLERHNRHV